MDAAPLSLGLVSLHTSPWAEPGTPDAGGMNVVVREQATALGAAGHDVHVITRRSSPDAPAASSPAPGVTLHLVDAGPPRMIAKAEHEAVVGEFERGLDALGPFDVLHANHWYSGLAALPVARRRGVPLVTSFHSIAAADDTALSAGERAETPGRLDAERRLARESDAVVAVSRAEARTVTERLGGDGRRVHVVAPGVDAAVFTPAAGPAATPGTVVAAARVEPLKGLDLAIEAVAGVPRESRPRLVVAGDAADEHREHLAALVALAAERGAAADVEFLGTQSRSALAALLRDAVAVLVPSHSETYGLVALEAAASGVPVVAACSGGLCEAVLDGETGIVLTTREPAAWTAALERLLDDDVLRARLGSAGRDHAVGLGWDRSARALADVYRGLVGRVDEPCRGELRGAA